MLVVQALPREDVPIREGLKVKGLSSDGEEIELCLYRKRSWYTNGSKTAYSRQVEY